MRVYDPRIAKFLRVDPLTRSFPWYTPYQYAGNSPIANIDLDGAEPRPANTLKGTKEAETTTTKETRSIVMGAAGTGHTETYTATKKWYWHTGGLQQQGTINKTEAGWYSSGDYANLLTNTYAASGLAYSLNLYNFGSRGNYDDQYFQEALTEFVGTGLNQDAAAHLIAAAQIEGDRRSKHVVGNLDLSSVNVEDLLIVGLVAKQGLKYLGTVALKSITSSQTHKLMLNKIALGVSDHLDDFAKRIGGATWETWGARDFEIQFLEIIGKTDTQIHFNLLGPDGEMINVWKALSEGAKGLNKSRATSWELYQIYSNPEAFKRTIFYLGDKVLTKNPFD